jgi:hypothetical protein
MIGAIYARKSADDADRNADARSTAARQIGRIALRGDAASQTPSPFMDS